VSEKLNQMAPATYLLLVSFLALVTSQAIASDPSPLQDFCVADIHSPGMHALTLRARLEARYLVQNTYKLQARQFFQCKQKN
jgi:hypothetical protein